MREKTLYISNPSTEYYLTDILKDHDYNGLIPTNTILNKRLPGWGATYGELHAHRHSIIIEPYVTVIEVKKNRMDDKLCAVFSKYFDINELITYLNNPAIEYKKIMTTPESFVKVIRVLKKFYPNYRKDYFLLIDECETITLQALFRERITQPLEEFFLFTNKALVSATALKPTHPEFERQSFTYLDLKPTFDYKKNIKLLVTNNIRTSLRNTIKLLNLENDNKPVFLFTNCTKTILYFTRLEEVRDDFKVFCAEDLDERIFKVNEVPNVNYSVTAQEYAKYNAFTSRFFQAVDMIPHNFAHVIIVTNVAETRHSMIDPFTDAIQISGRNRLQTKEREQKATITHITNLFPTPISGIDKDLKMELYFINRLQDLINKSTDLNTIALLKSIIEKEKLSTALNNNGEFNPFKKDNHKYQQQKERLYHSAELLKAAYEETEYFNVSMGVIKQPISDYDELRLRRTGSGVAYNKAFIEILSQVVEMEASYERDYHLQKMEKDDQLLYHAYHELGIDKIKKLRYSKRQITNEIINLRKGKKEYPFLMIDKILTVFRIGVTKEGHEIKAQLQQIYNEFKYEKVPGAIHVAKASDIEKFFRCHVSNGKKKIGDRYPTYYQLIEPIDNISKGINYLIS